jgi:ATP-dependent exoDNAse (exonuclease V) beta subunit
MTVHKSKGLEFDIVILPQIGKQPMEQVRDQLLVSRGERGEPEWLLERPPTAVWEWDGRLKDVIKETQTRAAFEGLCRLYVAMTRAERALYIFCPEKQTVRSEARILSSTLAGEEPLKRVVEGVPMTVLFEAGSEDWFEGEAKKAAVDQASQPVGTPRVLGDLLREVNRPVQRRTPSGAERLKILGANLLSPQRESARGFGTLVHLLFGEIEWLEADDDAPLHELWSLKHLDRAPTFDNARDLVLKAMAVPEIRACFFKPTPSAEAWRERSFDLLLGREWISGQIDRVVIERDAQGKATRATVYDFKTDAAPDDAALREKAEGYAPQLDLYRKAVARLTGLALKDIRAALIFCSAGKVVWA